VSLLAALPAAAQEEQDPQGFRVPTLNTTYSVGRSSDGVVSIGAPLLVHGGIRISFR
jgi:hypothetical protein